MHFPSFQCDEGCAGWVGKFMADTQCIGDKTPHLLSHTFTSTNEDIMRGIVKAYIENNPEEATKTKWPLGQKKKDNT